ncbi:hypothetical protein Hanom_Chr16g01457711 [Helianthus anomalus]
MFLSSGETSVFSGEFLHQLTRVCSPCFDETFRDLFPFVGHRCVVAAAILGFVSPSVLLPRRRNNHYGGRLGFCVIFATLNAGKLYRLRLRLCN